MREQLRRDPLVFRENEVRAAQRLGRAWAQIAQIPDGCRDDIEAGREGLVIHVRPLNGIEGAEAATSS
jgi:hypothetical protein